MKQFTEKDTESFYNKEDKLYLSFWDSKGSLHWGLFQENNENIVSASHNLTKYMIKKSNISTNSNVLDIGCGNGEVDLEIVKSTGCKLTGIDLSGVRIENARKKITNSLKGKLEFIHGSATNLPFNDNQFTHVISQATIYHIHDKQKAISEIHRVLKTGGVFTPSMT